MVNVCIGICTKYKATGFKGHHRYETGQKRCPECEIFMVWEGIRCPCCSVLLRCTPRGNKSRQELSVKRNCVWH